MLALILIMKQMLIFLRQSCLSSASQRNKAKRDRWTDKQTRISRNIRKEYQKMENVASNTVYGFKKRMFKYSISSIQISVLFLFYTFR